MWIVTIIAIVILLLIVVILCSKIKVDIWIRKKDSDDEIVFNIRMVYGLVRLHYQLPMMKLMNMEKGIKLEVDMRNNVGIEHMEHRETNVNKSKIDRWTDTFIQVLEATEDFIEWLKRTLSRITISKLEWSTNLCAGDAAYTAVLTGMLWSTKTFIVGWLSHHVRMKDCPRLFIVPDFDDSPHFTSEMSCILQISCGHAIYAGFVLFVRVLKVKGGVKKWKHILFKA